MRPGNEPVDDCVHKGKDDGNGVKQGEVKLPAQTGQVSGQGQEADDPPFTSAFNVVRIWVVQVSKGPALCQCQPSGQPRLGSSSSLQR